MPTAEDEGRRNGRQTERRRRPAPDDKLRLTPCTAIKKRKAAPTQRTAPNRADMPTAADEGRRSGRPLRKWMHPIPDDTLRLTPSLANDFDEQRPPEPRN